MPIQFHSAGFGPLRSNFGLELWLGNNPDVPGTWSWGLHPNGYPPEAEKYVLMGEIRHIEMKQREAIAFMKAHPGETANFMCRRFIENWLGVTDAVSDIWPQAPWYLRGLLVLNCALAVFCLLGALFALRQRKPGAEAYALVLLGFPLVFYLTHSSLRYRFPMDPLMIVLAVYGLAHPISLLARRATGYPATELAGDARPYGFPAGQN